MVHSISSTNSLLSDIQGIVDSFLKEQDQSMQFTDLVQAEPVDLDESPINAIECQINPDAIQSDERHLWVRVQEKRSKIQAWEEKFRKIDGSSFKSPYRDEAAETKESERSVDCAHFEIDESILQDDSVAIQSDEKPLWVRLQEKKNQVLAQEKICLEIGEGNDIAKVIEVFHERVPLSEAVDCDCTLSNKLAELNQQYERLIQLADQALDEAEQQHQEWDSNLQNFQRLKQEAESIQTDLAESGQRVVRLEEIQMSQSRALSNIQMTHSIQEKQAKKVLADLSKIESDQNAAREQLRAIDVLQTNVTEVQDELLNRLNRIPEPSILDSLKVIAGESYSYLGSRSQETVSKIKDVAKDLPTNIRNISLSLWDTFTLLSSATIQAISLLGQQIFKAASKVWNYTWRTCEEWMIGTHTLAALGATSLCMFTMSKDPLSFAATAVCGFLLIRRISRTIGYV